MYTATGRRNLSQHSTGPILIHNPRRPRGKPAVRDTMIKINTPNTTPKHPAPARGTGNRGKIRPGPRISGRSTNPVNLHRYLRPPIPTPHRGPTHPTRTVTHHTRDTGRNYRSARTAGTLTAHSGAIFRPRPAPISNISLAFPASVHRTIIPLSHLNRYISKKNR